MKSRAHTISTARPVAMGLVLIAALVTDPTDPAAPGLIPSAHA